MLLAEWSSSSCTCRGDVYLDEIMSVIGSIQYLQLLLQVIFFCFIFDVGKLFDITNFVSANLKLVNNVLLGIIWQIKGIPGILFS